MDKPSRIFDLHTHLFNARYVPLASVIANAMGKDESKLANLVARLLELVTGSSYPETNSTMVLLSGDERLRGQNRIDQIWEITSRELMIATGSLDGVTKGYEVLLNKPLSDPTFHSLRSSELKDIIEALSNIDYAEEGWKDSESSAYAGAMPNPEPNLNLSLQSFIDLAKRAVKKALRVVTELMDPKAWGEKENYLEFFLTMLNSEEKILEKAFSGYGDDLPPLQICHYMMDMQMAYAGHKPPYYPFHSVQLNRMQLLHRTMPARVFGFSAFDPRRPDWQKCAEDSLAMGFKGFKFYPAMGYKPVGNDEIFQERIDSFFDFCVSRDVPIFAHCTPEGFQTRHKEGRNAHPKYWREVLANGRWTKLRLCLGHAGGGWIENGDLKSRGWMASSSAEWNDDDNFARIVTELCVAYPYVYCEVGNIVAMFKEGNIDVFADNLERARNTAAAANAPYDLLEKLAYGSDWHMPDMVDNTAKFAAVFLDLMNRHEYRSYLDHFFWKNAYKYLNLPA